MYIYVGWKLLDLYSFKHFIIILFDRIENVNTILLHSDSRMLQLKKKGKKCVPTYRKNTYKFSAKNEVFFKLKDSISFLKRRFTKNPSLLLCRRVSPTIYKTLGSSPLRNQNLDTALIKINDILIFWFVLIFYPKILFFEAAVLIFEKM